MKKSLTLGDDLSVLDQVVDMVSHIDELLLLLRNALLLQLHESADVGWEEVRLDSVNDIEEEVSVHNLLLAQVWQVLLDILIFDGQSLDVLG